MRIIGGSAKGRRIATPTGDAVRPTSDRVREAIFNALYSRIDLDDATVIDLFAGTGALGLEALSRGARSCVFVDSDRRSTELVQANVGALGFSDRAEVRRGDALDLAARLDAVDVAFCDPPYAFEQWDPLLEVLRAAIVVCESSEEISGTTSWQMVRSRRYGSTVVTLLQREGR